MEVLSFALLEPGARSQDVIHLQAALARAGCLNGDIDGVFGPSTREALSRFQAKAGIASSGQFTDLEAALLYWQRWQPDAGLCPSGLEDAVSRMFAPAARSNIAANLPAVWKALADQQLVDAPMLAVAMATVCVESSLFLPVSEGVSTLNTTLGGQPFDRYDTRSDLGNKGTPDGSHFRGRGFIQLTGRANYSALSKHCHLQTSLEQDPFQAHQSSTAAQILAVFLKLREARIRAALASGQLDAVRKIVNGGLNGLEVFIKAFRIAQSLFRELPGPLQSGQLRS